MTSRIHRGFHQIGTVLAVPVLLVAVGLAGHEAWLQWTTKDPWAAFPIVEPARPATAIPQARNLHDTGPDDWVYPSEIAAGHAAPYAANYTLASLALGLALALYAAARAVGWVLAGFLSPSH